jgi:signal transduction histidine kinase
MEDGAGCEQNRVLADFLRGATHDLRAPLAQLRALTTLLARRHKVDLGEDGRALCGHIESAADRALLVVQAMQDYAQMDEPGVFENLDCETLLKAALAGVSAGGADIVRGVLPQIRGDRRKLIRLFRELVANAIKFRSAAPVRVQVSACPAGDFWAFSFRDNGMGIPPGKEDAVFEPFKRLHGHEQPGTGLGLAICRRIVQLHNGRIWAEAVADEGADFRFLLPGA